MKHYTDIFLDLDNTLYDTKYLLEPRPVEGAIELLDFLHKKNLRMHICSNGSRQGRWDKLRAIGIADYFENVITSQDAETDKPDPWFFEYALILAQAKPETTLMIGDNYDTDIIGASAVGIDTVLFNCWERDWMPPGPVTFRVNELKEIIQIINPEIPEYPEYPEYPEKTKMKITLITGGQRSGKSEYAERLALQQSPNPVYIATAHVWDDDFRQRVKRHQERRGPEWTNIEEELWLSRIDVSGRTVLIDCLTLWATNFFFAAGDNADITTVLDTLKQEFERFIKQDANFIFVTNEIGMGGTSSNAVQRRFTDLLGWLNQYVASRADSVTMLISGIPLKIK